MANLQRQTRSQVTRAAFLEAAISLLNDESSGDLSMPGVAQAAGKSVGALYEHFGSKDALLAAVGEAYVARRDAFLNETFAEARWSESTRVERVDGFVRSFAEWYRQNRGVLRLVILRAWSTETQPSEASVEGFRRNIRFVGRFIVGSRFEELTPAQARATENGVHYAIILARDALVIDDATQQILEAGAPSHLEEDLIEIVNGFLDRIPS